jgi:hypothetical protein
MASRVVVQAEIVLILRAVRFVSVMSRVSDRSDSEPKCRGLVPSKTAEAPDSRQSYLDCAFGPPNRVPSACRDRVAGVALLNRADQRCSAPQICAFTSIGEPPLSQGFVHY